MFDESKPDQQHLAPELVALERQLLGLTPALPRIDRDRLMFDAGRAAALTERGTVVAANEPSPSPSLRGRGIEVAATLRVAGRRAWFWPAATAMMTAASLFLATMLVWQNRSQFVAQQPALPERSDQPREVAHSGDVPPATSFAVRERSPKPALTSGYLGIRYVAVTAGVGALPDDFQAATAGRDASSKKKSSEPATVRNLMNELLPAPASSKPTRS
jgi:hypothetical protein